MDGIKPTDNVLIIGNDEKSAEELRSKCPNAAITLTTFHNVTGNDTYDYVLINAQVANNNLSNIFKTLKPSGKLLLHSAETSNDIEFALKTSGFINVQASDSGISICEKPSYQIGSSSKLTLKKPAGAVWKLDDNEEDDTIDPDNLLDEDDLKKPTVESLRVCGTTGKRKACKDCSCGLADELAAEKGDVIDTTNAPKSSCGSCYLGDAFRCAACPYLGMPAFKPGEKVQLIGNQLQDDI